MAYRLDGKARMSVDTEINASLSNDKNSNQVTLTISNTNKVDGAMLGYENFKKRSSSWICKCRNW